MISNRFNVKNKNYVISHIIYFKTVKTSTLAPQNVTETDILFKKGVFEEKADFLFRAIKSSNICKKVYIPIIKKNIDNSTMFTKHC
jgi:hypothetical protein